MRSFSLVRGRECDIVLNWVDIDPRYFEKFVYRALQLEGFHNMEWHGRGGADRGRDVVAFSTEVLPFGLSYEIKWIFQCKKWRKFPSHAEILNEVSKAEQHSPDIWVLVIPVDATSSMIDYFKFLQNSKSYKVKLMPLIDVESIINKHPKLEKVLLEG
ncbi:restriction endonuclease [Paenibacillus sp. FSL E2-0230]|uniref:restriction endonuclease n=1 Tax=Paenibacillus sp. FSL E2-0230 TaxID=2954727 RepID=UPI0030D19338